MGLSCGSLSGYLLASVLGVGRSKLFYQQIQHFPVFCQVHLESRVSHQPHAAPPHLGHRSVPFVSTWIIVSPPPPPSPLYPTGPPTRFIINSIMLMLTFLTTRAGLGRGGGGGAIRRLELVAGASPVAVCLLSVEDSLLQSMRSDVSIITRSAMVDKTNCSLKTQVLSCPGSGFLTLC